MALTQKLVAHPCRMVLAGRKSYTCGGQRTGDLETGNYVSRCTNLPAADGSILPPVLWIFPSVFSRIAPPQPNARMWGGVSPSYWYVGSLSIVIDYPPSLSAILGRVCRQWHCEPCSRRRLRVFCFRGPNTSIDRSGSLAYLQTVSRDPFERGGSQCTFRESRVILMKYATYRSHSTIKRALLLI